MNSQTWKNFERTVARFFGTERMPLSGMSNYLEKQDTLSDSFFIECKMRTKMPIYDYWQGHGDFILLDRLAVIHSTHLKEWKMPKGISNRYSHYYKLWQKTEELAEGSGKIPIVAVKKFGVKGFLIIFQKTDMDKIKQLIEPIITGSLISQVEAGNIDTKYQDISTGVPLVQSAKNYLNYLSGKPRLKIQGRVQIGEHLFCRIPKEEAEKVQDTLEIYEVSLDQERERLLSTLEGAQNYNVNPKDITIQDSLLDWIIGHPQELVDELENLVFLGKLPKRDCTIITNEIAKKVIIRATL